MSKTPDESLKSRKRLGLLKQEINLQRHPSVKSLFSENIEISKTDSTDTVTSQNNTINIINSANSSKSQNYNFKRIHIITCEHKLNNNETFFIRANPEEIDSNNRNNNINNNLQYDEQKILYSNNIKTNNNNKLLQNIKPSFYDFSDEQKELDKKITDDMARGKDYSFIENTFKGLLKSKK